MKSYNLENSNEMEHVPGQAGKLLRSMNEKTRGKKLGSMDCICQPTCLSDSWQEKDQTHNLRKIG